MSLIVVLIMVSLVASLLVAWPSPEPSSDAHGGRGRSEAPASAAEPESFEGILAAQVVTGEIARRQYLREMTRLAARDDKRHPLSVPPPKADAAGDS